jgi:hypothetical protein
MERAHVRFVASIQDLHDDGTIGGHERECEALTPDEVGDFIALALTQAKPGDAFDVTITVQVGE